MAFRFSGMNLHLDAGRVHFPYEGIKDKGQGTKDGRTKDRLRLLEHGPLR